MIKDKYLFFFPLTCNLSYKSVNNYNKFITMESKELLFILYLVFFIFRNLPLAIFIQLIQVGTLRCEN